MIANNKFYLKIYENFFFSSSVILKKLEIIYICKLNKYLL